MSKHSLLLHSIIVIARQLRYCTEIAAAQPLGKHTTIPLNLICTCYSPPTAQVYDALTYLGSIPWRINNRVLDVMRHVWDNHSEDDDFEPAGLPSKHDVTIPAMPRELPFRLTRNYGQMLVGGGPLHSAEKSKKLEVRKQI